MNTSTSQRILWRLRQLGPYFALALVLPGGSLLVLLLWYFERRHGKA